MIYDKAPIILLSKIASLPGDSTNCRIATYILKHLDTVGTESISDLAEHCGTAISSVSRFCREIGLPDFFELKGLLEDTSLRFERASAKTTAKDRAADHALAIARSLEDAAASLDYAAIRELASDIREYRKVTAFGLLKAETAALNLQADLLMLKKFVVTKLAFDDQLKCLNEADEDDLIVIFSYTGTYFTEGAWDIDQKKSRPRVYLISGDTSQRNAPLVYRTISFASPQNQIAHPYQLLFASSIIAQEYRELWTAGNACGLTR